MSLPVVQSRPSIRQQDVAGKDWQDWRWQLRNMLRTAEDFSQLFPLSDSEAAGFAVTKPMFRTGATPYYASLMDPAHPECPIRRQALPSPKEANIKETELRDPLGEERHSPVSSVFHKYPDRCLLYVVDRCAIYCRHCNRRRIVGGDSPPTQDQLDEGIAYIASQKRIRDVLISGGDPLLLSNRRLDQVLGRLRQIEHVEIIRIGSRVPVVLPMRIDDELCQTLAKHQPVFINTHFNHPVELTADSTAACQRLVDHGILVGNQTVLLRGINSSVPCLRALCRGLIRNRIRPYYLFQGDTVMGTDHLRTRVETAIELMDGLRGWMSSMALPHLVLDAPGGGGKIPIGPQYLVSLDEQTAYLRNYRGQSVLYPQPEKSDATVAYDAIYFRGIDADDDREGGP